MSFTVALGTVGTFERHEGSERGDEASEPYLGDLVILQRDLSPTEAHMLCARLRASGIGAEAADTYLVQAHALIAIAVGGASVRVPSTQLGDARAIMAALARGDFDLGESFDPDQGDDAAEPVADVMAAGRRS